MSTNNPPSQQPSAQPSLKKVQTSPRYKHRISSTSVQNAADPHLCLVCRVALQPQPVSIPEGTTAEAALKLVLQLPAVGSKRFLTTKVDRHVTGACSRCLPHPTLDVRWSASCQLLAML